MERNQMMIMKNFVDSFQSNEFESVLCDEFEQLKLLTNDIRHYKTKTTNEGERECNRKKNRYRDILPYDESRVILKNLLDCDKSDTYNDYINASFVNSAMDGHYKYIAAQGPNKETCLDFIRMLYQYNIKIVICACNEYEGQKLKCHRYWTDKMKDSYQFHKDYYVSLKSKPIMLDGCVIRELVVRHGNSLSMSESSSNSSFDFNDLNEFEFTQFHITNWPDHGVPDDVETIIKMLSIVRQKMYDNNKLLNENLFIKNYEANKNSSSGVRKRLNKIPLSSEYLAVHCSAGCGRTGTIIAIDQVWTNLNENKLTSDFSMYNIARLLREQRIAMIQTLSQYTLFAKAIVYLFEKKIKAYNDAIANEKFRNRLQTKMSQNNYENFPNYENIMPTPPNSTDQSPSEPAIVLSQSNILRSDNSVINSGDKVILRQNLNTPNSKNKLSRRSYMIESNHNTTRHKLSDENLRRNAFQFNDQMSFDYNDQNAPASTPNVPILNTNKRAAFSSIKNHNNSNNNNQSHISNSFENSLTIDSPTKQRYFSPHLLNVQKQNNDQNNLLNEQTNSSSNNTPNISSTSSSSSSSSTAMSKNNKSQNETTNDNNNATLGNEDKNNETDLQYANSSKLFLNKLSTKQQNLIRSARVNITPSATYSKGKNVSKFNNFISKSENMRVDEVFTNSASKQSSPLSCYPRKLFQQNSTNQVDSEKAHDHFSMSGSLYLENSGSVTDASGRLNNKNSAHKNYGELYLNDESLYKKEPGSVCEFLSNRLDNSKIETRSPRGAQSPSITSLDATTSLSSSVNSTANPTPVTTPTIGSKNQFKINPNQAKLSLSRQIDLRKTNPPQKAELYESLNKAEGLMLQDNSNMNVVEKNFQSNDDLIEHDCKNIQSELPKAPVRRNKKSTHEQPYEGLKNDSDQNRVLPRNEFDQSDSSVYTPKYESPKMPESQAKTTTVIYRNRSNSSTKYDNNSGEYIDRFSKFQNKFMNSSSESKRQQKNDLNLHSSKTNKSGNDQNIRNGLYIDLNVIKELRAKKSKPQFKL